MQTDGHDKTVRVSTKDYGTLKTERIGDYIDIERVKVVIATSERIWVVHSPGV